MAEKDRVLEDVLTLADLLRAEWPAACERIRLSGAPTCKVEDDEAAKAEAEKAAAEAEAARKAAESDDEDDEDKITKDDDWQTKARKSERQRKRADEDAKRIAKERDDLKATLAKIEQSNLSDQEKAIAKAREEAASEVTSKFEAERRTDRIEHAVTRLSLQGFKVGEGDKATTLRFADPDDAQLRIERALRNGDLTHDEIYGDGKVKPDALKAFLTELLEEHPRLRAEDGNRHKQEIVDLDGGKGKGGGAKSLEDMTPDEHYKAIQGAR